MKRFCFPLRMILTIILFKIMSPLVTVCIIDFQNQRKKIMRNHMNSQNRKYFDNLPFSFQFIKTLPPPSCQPPRPSVLPKKTRSSPPITLVLDLDETLVHCNTQAVESADVSFPVMFNGSLYTVSGNLRPHCLAFLKECSELFEVVLFTASQKIYADQLANIIDPQKTFFKYRLFRDSCTFVHGNYIKDLRVLGRDLSKTIIVDNSPQAFGYQLSNGIPIKSWYEDLNDTELMKVLDFLKSLNVEHIPDVRPLIKKTFNLEAQIFGANEERLN
ncbi:HAD-like domain-containing protein [Globomyces pollinis-pini]|nr:HAD-like domain-containing protein [Globomyces pollinis-pini]